MRYSDITYENREIINKFIIDRWYTKTMVVRGKEFDMTKMEGIFASNGGEILGLITYIIYDDVCEIMSLDSLCENKGVGTILVNKVIDIAKDKECKKVVLITTNDNINAIRFYQKRGFDMVMIYRNAVDSVRKLKPEIPLIGDNNIPLKHEIEFELVIENRREKRAFLGKK